MNLGPYAIADRHLERVAARVGARGDRCVDRGELLRGVIEAGLGAGDGAGQGVLVSLVGALQALEACTLGVGGGLVEHERVAGCEGFELGEGEAGCRGRCATTPTDRDRARVSAATQAPAAAGAWLSNRGCYRLPTSLGVAG